MNFSPAIFLGAFISVSTVAQQALEPLVVSATRSIEEQPATAAYIETITQQEIQRLGVTTVADVLRSRGGITIVDPFGDGNGSVDLRGFGESASSNTLVLVDGRRLNNSDLSGPNLNSVALNNIERIEIVKGSAGSLYGDQAVGGVVNIITKTPEDFEGSIAVSSGSYHRRSLSFSLSDVLDNNLSYRLSGEALRTNNYRDNNDLRANNIFANVTYDNGNTRLFFDWNHDDENQELPGALIAEEARAEPRQSAVFFADDFSDQDESAYRIGIDQQLNDNWAFVAEYTDRTESTESVNNFRGCGVPGPFFFACSQVINTAERDQDSFNPRFVANYPLANGEIVITLGGDFTRTDYNSDIPGSFINRSIDQRINSYYAQAVIPVHKDTYLTLGHRTAHIKDRLRDNIAFPNGDSLSDSVEVYNIGLSKQIENLKLFVRYDENFRFAKVDEQVFTAVDVVGLDPQTGVSRELGFEYQTAKDKFTVYFYKLRTQNEIAFDPTANNGLPFFNGANVNFDSIIREGFVIDSKHSVNDALSLSFSYTSTDNTFSSGVFADNTVSGAPDSLARFAVSYNVTSKWSSLFELQHTGEQFLSGDNANAQDQKSDFSVFNLATSYVDKNWSATIRLNNVLNRRYSESENVFGAVNPSPERNLLVKARYEFQ